MTSLELGLVFVLLVLRMLRQENFHEFEASLSYIMTGWPKVQSESF